MNHKFLIFRIFLILDITDTFGPMLLYATCKYIYDYLLSEFRIIFSRDSTDITNKYKRKNILHERLILYSENILPPKYVHYQGVLSFILVSVRDLTFKNRASCI